jgi:peptidoglycan/xylan/chitin deacetylase (PgdA/CDA1 family)
LFNGLPPHIFEAQMRYVSRRYRVVSLDQLCDEMERPTQEGHAVAVTFDDGYRDLYTHALPVLQKYQIPATVFLPVACMETGQVPWYDRVFLALKALPGDHFDVCLDRRRRFLLSSFEARIQVATEIIQYLRTLPDQKRREHCENLEAQVTLPREELANRMLTWDQIRTMCRAGICFGSHTMTHPVVSRLTQTQLESELRQSKQILEERIGTPVRHFAFPFGRPADCGTAAPAVLAECGYRSAVTTVEGICAPGDKLFALPRLQTGEERSLSMYAFKLNQHFLSATCEHSVAAPYSSSPRYDW